MSQVETKTAHTVSYRGELITIFLFYEPLPAETRNILAEKISRLPDDVLPIQKPSLLVNSHHLHINFSRLCWTSFNIDLQHPGEWR